MTKQLLQAASVVEIPVSVVGIPVLDPLILGGEQYCSLGQTTNLWWKTPQE